MMAYKEIVATVGHYDKGGERKYVTRKVGTLIETNNGLRIKLEASFNPAGCQRSEDGMIWLSVFDPKPREENIQKARGVAGNEASRPAQQQPNFDDDFEDMPF